MNRRGRRARSSLLVGVALLSLSGCGRFASADRAEERAGTEIPAPPTSAARPSSSVGAGAAATTSPPTTDAPDADRSAPTTRPTVAREPHVANAASATTDGLEVEVVAEDGPDYPSRPRFRIQVTLTNRTDETRYYFLGQGNFAALTDATGALVWSSGRCNPTLETYEIYGGAAPVEPGEEIPVVVRYPQPDTADDLGCDLPDGRYTLYGLFPICPDEHVEETANPGTYSCPEERVEQHSSAGLAISIGAS